MGGRRAVAIVGLGLVNFLARFLAGGVLFLGVKLDPTGLAFGFSMTITALLAAYLLLRLVVRPRTVREAVGIGVIWAVLALVLDVATAEPIVGVTVSYLLSELQTWTRLAVIVAVAPFTVAGGWPDRA